MKKKILTKIRENESEDRCIHYLMKWATLKCKREIKIEEDKSNSLKGLNYWKGVEKMMEYIFIKIKKKYKSMTDRRTKTIDVSIEGYNGCAMNTWEIFFFKKRIQTIGFVIYKRGYKSKASVPKKWKCDKRKNL